MSFVGSVCGISCCFVGRPGIAVVVNFGAYDDKSECLGLYYVYNCL